MHAAIDVTAKIRALAPADLDAVVAIDAETEGRSRREYIERRLRAAQREPALHAQFAAEQDGALLGFILARVLAGEFGRRARVLRLELVGVRSDRRGHGVGQRLFEALADWGRRHAAGQVISAAHWRDTAILRWFDTLGFELAPDGIVDCALADPGLQALRDDGPLTAGAPSAEIDYGRDEAAGANDHDRAAAVEVRAMTPADLDAIVRIDRSITGEDRRDYIGGRLAEALGDTGVRVSLAARGDDGVVGYLMARADLGDFGRTEPVAVIDTLGVHPDYAHRGVGRALLVQLCAHLSALHVERIETVVAQRDLALLGFLYAVGFAPSQRLCFTRSLQAAT